MNLREHFWNELRFCGFATDAIDHDRHLEVIFEFGEKEKSYLIKSNGKKIWPALLDSIQPYRQEKDMLRVLGFGAALTSFIITPVDLNQRQRRMITSLGALCNLIVSLYDHFTDRLSPYNKFSFPAAAIEMTTRGDFSPLGKLMKQGTEEQRILSALILDYFKALKEIETDTEGNRVKHTLYAAILKMLQAENAISERPELSGELLVIRKSALPFVVMGLPSFFLVKDGKYPFYYRYLRWLYLFGEFIGWVDDIADFDKDRQSGHVNRMFFYKEVPAHLLMRSIALKGKKVLLHWEKYVRDNQIINSGERKIFTACIAAWLGIKLK